jgi:parvulin-like peptidyl-prolyl isomerase
MIVSYQSTRECGVVAISGRFVRRLLVACCAAWVSACAETEPPTLLARVGEVEIHIDDFFAYEAKIEVGDSLSLDEHRRHLGTLVDRELLIGEAMKMGLLENAELQQIMERNSTEKLAEMMFNREVADRSTPTHEEIEAAYASGDWWQQVVSVELFLPDEETAVKVRQEILDGLNVYEAAQLYSVDRMMHLPMGGAQQFVYSRFDGPVEIVQRVFQIPTGNISSPIPFRRGFILAYVAEYRTVEREDVADEIEQYLRKEKRKILRGAYLQHLNQALDLKFRDRGLEHVVEHLSRRRDGIDEPMTPDSTLIVYSYSGTEHSVKEVLKWVGVAATRWDTLNSANVIAQIKNTLLPDLLMAADAHRKGVDVSADFQAWKASRSEDLLLSLLQREVSTPDSLQEKEIIAHYHRIKSRFRIPGYARVRDLLVASKEEAEEYKQQVNDGADFAALVREKSLRRGSKKEVFRVFNLQAKKFGSAWMNYALNIAIGEIHGPVAAEGGYALIEVVERFADSYYSLKEARVRAAVRRDLQRVKARSLFNTYVQEVRDLHSDQTVVYADRLSNFVGR